jgi:P27 family predicted phage terminase small subunit
MPRRSRAEREFEAHLVEPAFEPEPLPAPAPEHLSPAMRKWWTTVTHTFVLEHHHLLLLEAACDAWDRTVQARETLRREGLSVPTGTGGTKKNPAVDIERDARAQFITALRTLDLDVETPKTDKLQWRPPALRSNRTG